MRAVDPDLDLYAARYADARQRFRDAARAAHAQLEAFPLTAQSPEGATLATDVARVGAREPHRALVVTSGLHGVEGFFGSAVQLGWLGAVAAGRVSVPSRATVVLVHAVNPYGVAWRRRVDEDNVDLNRNFLGPDEAYTGVPPLYEQVDRLLNPPSAPTRVDLFRLRAAWTVWLHGMPALRTAVAAGQYDHPDHLFFGGRAPAVSTRLVQQRFWDWTRGAAHVVHLDLHTGLGAYADYELLVEPAPASAVAWFRRYFDPVRVVPVAAGATARGAGDRAAYAARGVMGGWLARHAGDRRYRVAVAEFGTHPALRIVGALRAEHRAHRFAAPESSSYARAKRELMECFCPRDRVWRRRTVQGGAELLRQAVDAIANDAGDG